MKVQSRRGKIVDMGEIMERHAETVAVGNANMNARGDILDNHGTIKETREEQNKKYEAMVAYNQQNNKGVKQVSLSKPVMPDNVKIMTPQEAMARARRQGAKERKELKERLDTPFEEQQEKSVQQTQKKTRRKRKIVEK